MNIKLAHWLSLHSLAFLAAISVLFSTPAQSFVFSKGDLKGSLDTTLSYGAAWRVQDRDSSLIGLASGGTAFSVNVDDGNLNYDKGLVSHVVQVTSELDLNYRNAGAFIRGSAFYDFENENSSRERTPLSEEALELVGSDIDLLDAYVWTQFDVIDRPAQIRIGEQVVSWGESTFIQNSINIINPVDVSKLRVPGAELREALLPEGMAWTSLGITTNTNLEGFYLYDYDDTEIDPPGSYFSTNDFVGDGGNQVFLGFGSISDLGTQLPPALGGFDPDFLAVSRAPDRRPDDSGQYGVALKVFAPALNDTEFGFYFINYHSRLPLISARTGTAAGLAAANATFPALVREGVNPATAAAVATDIYASTARYFVEFPEDIKLFGISFNTTLPRSGIALQGEVSHRWDMPLQIDDVEILFAALSPLGFNSAFKDNQIGIVIPDSEVSGFIRRNVTQVQATATQLFGPRFGADQFVLVGEVGVTHVHDMPAKASLRLQAPGTFTSGNPNQAVAPGVDPAFPLGGAHAGKPAESADNFADATSWGYRLVGRLIYNNAIGAITLSPRIGWQHDVNGTSPQPAGPFLEGRKTITLGLGASYLNTWSADLSYTNFFGAGRHNLLNDRDFVEFSIKYAF